MCIVQMAPQEVHKSTLQFGRELNETCTMFMPSLVGTELNDYQTQNWIILNHLCHWGLLFHIVRSFL